MAQTGKGLKTPIYFSTTRLYSPQPSASLQGPPTEATAEDNCSGFLWNTNTRNSVDTSARGILDSGGCTCQEEPALLLFTPSFFYLQKKSSSSEKVVRGEEYLSQVRGTVHQERSGC